MNNKYSPKVFPSVIRFLSCLFVLALGHHTDAQSLACNAGVNVSLDPNCEALIDATYILKGEPDTADPSDFLITITDMDGSTPDTMSVRAGNSAMGPFSASNEGEFILLSGTGKYKVSVRRKSDGVNCWGDLLVEDKLLPFTVECACPSTATVVPELCRFSCASVTDFLNNDSLARIRDVNPVFRDNCGNLGGIDFVDDLVRDSICGNWVIMRTWRTLVRDAKGNLIYKELGCSQKFLFESEGVEAVFPPKKRVVVECGTDIDPESLRNYFSDTTRFSNATADTGICYAYPFLQDTINMDTIVFQEIGRGLITGSNDDLCKLTATATDVVDSISVCGSIGYKVVRRWDVLDWCDNETRQFFQVIKVEDSSAPFFEIPDTITASATDPWKCTGEIFIAAPDTLADNCSTVEQLDYIAFVLISGTRIEANRSNGYTLSGVLPGRYVLTYVVTDLCGNESIKQNTLIVTDDVKPVALSKHEIVVTFTSDKGDCSAKVFPRNIDAGSFDACTDVTLEIRRKDSGDYASFVKFSQDDINDVTDSGIAFGIVNIELRVTDEAGNTNITWTKVRLEDKNAQLRVDCGDTEIALDCTDDLQQAIMDEAPTAQIFACKNSNLIVDTIRRSTNVDPQCNTGTVVVDYFIQGRTSAICTKTFVLGDVDSIAIVFPDAEIEVACDDTDFGDVIFPDNQCNLLKASEEIRDFDIAGDHGYCKKLVREITVIDWCTYIPNRGDTIGLYRFRQVIKVKDDTVPTITCTDVELTAGDNCEISGFQINAFATDAGGCSDQLSIKASIDTDEDGDADVILDGIISETGDVMAIVSSPLTVGTYTVNWTAADECGNVGRTSCTIRIKDDKAPTPACITTISTATMNTDGSVGIWANDFDLNSQSTDNCGGPIRYSFSSSDPNVASRTFTCANLSSNGVSEVIPLRVYVWDEDDNVDFCNVMLRIDDNVDACPDNNRGSAVIGGRISTPQGASVESAQVYVSTMEGENSEMNITDVDGNYAFTNTPMMSAYDIRAEKSDDYLNGLSTLDIIMMQRHILNIAPFESGWQWIASDVNLDERITALDLVEMRRLLLGSADGFSGGRSWSFVSAAQSMDEGIWPMSDIIRIDALDKNMRDQDFVAIKLGDVNGNAVANSALLGKGRSKTVQPVFVMDRQVYRGEVVTISMNLGKDVNGLQFDAHLNAGEWQEVSSDDMSIQPEHIQMDHEHLMMSWNDVTPISAEGELSLTFVASREGMLSDIVDFARSSIAPEVYVGANLEVRELQLSWTTESEIKQEFQVYQNVPNPWAVQTKVGFQIRNAGQVDLAVFDMTGRQLLGSSAFFEAGYNEFRVDQRDVSTDGVLYYQLTYDNQVVTRKMIALD
ncbi:MAG: T9SS type A sorting domain-containing protein [Bacteroidota bacterium]